MSSRLKPIFGDLAIAGSMPWQLIRRPPGAGAEQLLLRPR
jgi:hypothetical protein